MTSLFHLSQLSCPRSNVPTQAKAAEGIVNALIGATEAVGTWGVGVVIWFSIIGTTVAVGATVVGRVEEESAGMADVLGIGGSLGVMLRRMDMVV
jgi:hypothetical protein